MHFFAVRFGLSQQGVSWIKAFLETASLHYHQNLEWRTCHDKHNLICFDTITCQAIYLYVQNNLAIWEHQEPSKQVECKSCALLFCLFSKILIKYNKETSFSLFFLFVCFKFFAHMIFFINIYKHIENLFRCIYIDLNMNNLFEIQ